jgi:hypothetical protein
MNEVDDKPGSTRNYRKNSEEKWAESLRPEGHNQVIKLKCPRSKEEKERETIKKYGWK